MCGIVAVLRRPGVFGPPDLVALVEALTDAEERLETLDPARAFPAVADVARKLAEVDAELLAHNGVAALIADPVRRIAVEQRVEACTRLLLSLEARLDEGVLDGADVEAVNAALIAGKDALWAIGRDRIGTARAVEDLARGASAGPAALNAFHSIEIALSALDRLEVRGRDSAGLHVLVTGHRLDLHDPVIARLVDARARDHLFTSGAVRTPAGHLSFVYKTAAEIGELGDNTARLRAQVRDDELLRLALRADGADAAVLAHTRWASVGIISEPNAHPLDQEEVSGGSRPYVTAVLNGDVDNYGDLMALEHLRFVDDITTDAKVIPALVARRLERDGDLVEAFRATVASFEGSVAIGAQSAADPDCVLLAQRGSGQALYVGLAPWGYVVTSEPYGLVAECPSYVRLDGETMLEPRDPASQGQVVALDRKRAGSLAGIRRLSYDGRELPVTEDDVRTSEITTRDVDRGEAPHYLFKEITEAPGSVRKTLRGKIVEHDGRLAVSLPPGVLPESVRARLRSGEIRRVLVIGQGT